MADQPVSSAELKKLRTPVRARFTKAFNELETEIKKREVKKADVEKILRRLQTHHEKLSILNMRMEEALLRESASEDIFTAEYESVCEYEDNFSNIMTDYEALAEKDDVSTISGTAAMNYRLPKLEFKKFGGEPREWITFWSQFSTIDRDPQMPPETKFQYLFQATAENSEAREAVESFPPSADNYPKVIEYIKSRFGGDKMLVEIYVRDLLQNVRAEGKMSVVKLYDRLETLRALETLGVARDKFAAMLYPLVESALPEDTLRVWERSQYTVSGRGVQDKLTQLITFLKTEVKGESRVNMAKAAFKIDNNQDAKDDRSNRKSLSKKNTGKKKDKAKGKNVCFWCLLPGHGFKKCRIKPRCPVCGGKHYPIMCPTLEAQKTSHLQKAELKVSRESPATKQETANQFTSTTLNNATVGGVYLQTLIVKISGPKGKHNVRVLLDCGSQRSYISKRMVDALGLKRVQQVTLTHNLFGGGEISQNKHNVYKVNVSSLNNEYMDDLKFLDQEVICGHISQVQDHIILNELKARGINSTDICQGEEISIHMLIGSDLLSSILTGRMQILQNRVVATETKLGWTVMGPAIGKDMEVSCLIVTSFHVNSFDVQNLWKLDVLGIMDAAETKSRKDLIEASNTHFKETVKRDESGRYIVSLPWIAGHPPVPVNRRTTENRLLTTTRNVQGKMLYGNIRRKLQEKEAPIIKSMSGKGDNLIELIPDLLLRFRLGKYGIIEDMRKAFLQIQVREEDREFLRFLWWKKDQKTLKFYKHCRVVFGLTSSPFLLAATIKYHLSLPQFQDNRCAELLARSFYVDNCILSLSSTHDVKKIIKESSDIMMQAKFELRDWMWNEPGITKQDPASILGMKWHLQTDTIAINVQSLKNIYEEKSITKRSILSACHRFFYPIQFTCPATIKIKKMVQDAWKENKSWDEQLNEDRRVEFIKWRKQALELDQIKIPRWILPIKARTTLHVFCDASAIAYATVIFMRIENASVIVVRFVEARNRLATIKRITIPRLELLACLIGARLLIQQENWAQFVSNRVKEITTLTKNEDWNHVAGEHNPADLPSRGESPSKFTRSGWWEGPKWLQEKKEDWPVSKVQYDLEAIEEERRKTVVAGFVAIKPEENPWYLNLYEGKREVTLTQILRVIAWMIRFKPSEYKGDIISKEELDSAEKSLVKIIQSESIGEEDPKMKQLHAFQDKEGLWRVKTRIVNRNDDELFRLPILIPTNHPVIELIVKSVHEKMYHCGAQTLRSLLRRLLGKRVVNYEEMVTILENCERVINARPLTYIAEDNDDLVPSTPVMFLREPRTEGEIDLNEFRCNFGKSYEKRKRLLKEFRKKFRSEYLGLLVHHDNRKKQRQLKVGDIVLVEVENRKQINWPMGKITKVFPGTDNVRRLVEVKTKSGFMKREVQRLFPLEVPSKDVEQDDGELKPAEDEIVREKTPGVESVSVQEKTTPVKVGKVYTRSGRKGKILGEVDAQVEDIMLADESFKSQDWEKEQQMVEQYEKGLVVTEIKVNEYLKVREIGHKITGERDSAKTGQVGLAACRLPKISLAIYDGTCLDWLGWWPQFETIHENSGISEVDKFRYLMQSIKKGTRAERLVRSYPLTKENYPRVIKALKDRFDDSTILTEVYIRQLLKLVVNIVRRKNLSLESMYDQSESHLKSLESLRVNIQQNAYFLNPMVESSLPEDLLRTWQRSALAGYDVDDGELPPTVDKKLTSLLEFMRREVNREQRLGFIRDGLGESSRMRTNRHYVTKMHAAEVKSNTEKVDPHSIICQGGHWIQRCPKWSAMPVTQRTRELRSLGAFLTVYAWDIMPGIVETPTIIHDGETIIVNFNSNQELNPRTYRKRKWRILDWKIRWSQQWAMERRLDREVYLRGEYCSSMKDYEELDHMTPLPEQAARDVEGCCFLPHHAVRGTQPDKKKLRVVFDAATKTTNGFSLNDRLYAGPKLQNDISSVLLRWRLLKIVMVAEIEKMYRQILVQPQDALRQRILWRQNSRETMRPYQLNTVRYGTSPAPFLALRTLIQLAKYGHLYPKAAEAIRRDTYVDDILTGPENSLEAMGLQRELIDLLRGGGFVLKKWTSMDPALLDQIPEGDRLEQIVFEKTEIVKTLGLGWDPREDFFVYAISYPSKTEEFTKRQMLYFIAKQNDPMGWMAPLVIVGKILIQRIWITGTTWDEPLDDSIKIIWQILAPIRRISIPRLELCAAVLLTRLVIQIMPSLELDIESITCWTDATIVLQWIKTLSRTLPTFVGNRVSEIQACRKIKQWRHVPSKDNPADIASRGTIGSGLRDSQLWWKVPTRLAASPKLWPEMPNIQAHCDDTEALISSVSDQPSMLIVLGERCFSLIRYQRIVAWIMRFGKNCRARDGQVRSYLTLVELREAQKKIVLAVQSHYFREELKSLKDSDIVKRSSPIYALNPFLDMYGVIRVGGRLKWATTLTSEQKHPALMPSKGRIED
ncbi:hypothetical protein LAZ67_10001662, partial [Cordylochernes scorpioides]